MKHKPGKPRAQALHVQVAELAQALAMPESKRSRGYNRTQRREKEYIVAANGLKAARHTR